MALAAWSTSIIIAPLEVRHCAGYRVHPSS
jgi:hypothetical protein